MLMVRSQVFEKLNYESIFLSLNHFKHVWENLFGTYFDIGLPYYENSNLFLNFINKKVILSLTIYLQAIFLNLETYYYDLNIILDVGTNCVLVETMIFSGFFPS